MIWLIKLNKVQFDSMAFQERNETCEMKTECSGRNLAERSGTDRDLKWDEICSVLFRFLNWYGMFQLFRAKQNEINNLDFNAYTWKFRSFFSSLLSSPLYCCPLTTKITRLDYFFLFSFTRYVFGKDRLPSSLGSSKSELGCNCEGYLEETR